MVNTLRRFVEQNEVVFQFCGELVEVSNDKEKENKEELLRYFSRANLVLAYDNKNSFIKEGWPELANLSTEEDVLFLLDGIGVLICIPRKLAIDNQIISE